MKTDAEREKLDRLTERVTGCGYEVSDTPGCGFLERVYEDALAVEPRCAGIGVEQEKIIQMGRFVRDFRGDRAGFLSFHLCG